MPMTEQELKNWEQRLVEERREVLEREMANKIERKAIETAKSKLAERMDTDRVDYLFDRINADNRKLVLEIPQPVEIRQPHTNHYGTWILITSTLAAAFAITATVFTVIF